MPHRCTLMPRSRSAVHGAPCGTALRWRLHIIARHHSKSCLRKRVLVRCCSALAAARHLALQQCADASARHPMHRLVSTPNVGLQALHRLVSLYPMHLPVCDAATCLPMHAYCHLMCRPRHSLALLLLLLLLSIC